jgi:hypothetical protein
VARARQLSQDVDHLALSDQVVERLRPQPRRQRRVRLRRRRQPVAGTKKVALASHKEIVTPRGQQAGFTPAVRGRAWMPPVRGEE